MVHQSVSVEWNGTQNRMRLHSASQISTSPKGTEERSQYIGCSDETWSTSVVTTPTGLGWCVTWRSSATMGQQMKQIGDIRFRQTVVTEDAVSLDFKHWTSVMSVVAHLCLYLFTFSSEKWWTLISTSSVRNKNGAKRCLTSSSWVICCIGKRTCWWSHSSSIQEATNTKQKKWKTQ